MAKVLKEITTIVGKYTNDKGEEKNRYLKDTKGISLSAEWRVGRILISVRTNRPGCLAA